MTFKEALVYAKELDVLLIPYELAKGMKETKELIRSIEPGKSIGVFIGPEGGFEEQEVQMPWKPVRNPSPWDTGSYGQKLRDSQYFLF